MRNKKYFLAIFVVFGLLVILPVGNYIYYNWAYNRAYRVFVAPQHTTPVVTLNSRLLPKYKNEMLRKILNENPQEFLLVYGNSSQFHLREEVFSAALGCSLKPFFNMSHHSIDYLDAQYFFRSISADVSEGWTVLLGVYPDMFTKQARTATPSIDHPWNNSMLWFENIRDGNTSVSSLFPRLINIEWPVNAQTWFPFLRQYSDIYELATRGKSDEFLYSDGSVQFIGADETRHARVAAGNSLDADNFRMIALQNLSSPFDERLLKAFEETVTMLMRHGARVIAYEAELTDYLGGARWAEPSHVGRYLDLMQRLQRSSPDFNYLEKSRTWINLPEEYWLDGSHVSFEGGEQIVRHLSGLIGADAMCAKGLHEGEG